MTPRVLILIASARFHRPEPSVRRDVVADGLVGQRGIRRGVHTLERIQRRGYSGGLAGRARDAQPDGPPGRGPRECRGPDDVGSGPGHTGLHVTGAGRGSSRPGGSCQRRVRPGLDSVRDSERRAAVYGDQDGSLPVEIGVVTSEPVEDAHRRGRTPGGQEGTGSQPGRSGTTVRSSRSAAA